MKRINNKKSEDVRQTNSKYSSITKTLFKPKSKQFYIATTIIIFTILSLSIYYNWKHLYKKPQNPTLHIPIFSTKDVRKVFIKDDFHDFDRIQREIELINRTHNLFRSDIEGFGEREYLFNEEKWSECLNDDKNFFRIYLDKSCYELWLFQLEYFNIKNIDNIEGVMRYADEKAIPKEERLFKSMSNGGVRMSFNSHSNFLISPHFNKAYWKPCTLETGHYETYTAEIVSFWIDRLLAFYHTPPVVPRYFSRFELLSLATLSELAKDRTKDKLAVAKIESILDVCGSKEELSPMNVTEGAEGAMVGWSPFPLKPIYSKNGSNFVLFSSIETEEQFEEMKKNYFTITNNSPKEEISIALEIISVHLYAMIIGNLRKFDHNLFLAYHEKTFQNGQFIYIDNDRSQWALSTYKLLKKQKINVLKKLCIFPTRIARNILLLRPENSENNSSQTLSFFIKQLAKIYHLKNEHLFNNQEAVILEMNIGYLADIIDNCVAQYGVDIFINEPWPDPYST